jgi:gamma-glutamyl:cysteine ligase YbdK (ATP-grasp superfamily)
MNYSPSRWEFESASHDEEVPLIFASYSEYQATVRSLIATKTIQEATQICWDLRPSEPYLEDLQAVRPL